MIMSVEITDEKVKDPDYGSSLAIKFRFMEATSIKSIHKDGLLFYKIS